VAAAAARAAMIIPAMIERLLLRIPIRDVRRSGFYSAFLIVLGDRALRGRVGTQADGEEGTAVGEKAARQFCHLMPRASCMRMRLCRPARDYWRASPSLCSRGLVQTHPGCCVRHEQCRHWLAYLPCHIQAMTPAIMHASRHDSHATLSCFAAGWLCSSSLADAARTQWSSPRTAKPLNQHITC
jgi:hypothetical protein